MFWDGMPHVFSRVTLNLDGVLGWIMDLLTTYES
jgi:hypothetical protein